MQGRVLQILILAAIYFAAGRLGLGLPVAHGNATPVWAPTGISLAALLIFGRGLWPGVVLGAFLVNATTPAPLVFSALAAIGNTAAVVLAFWLIEWQGGGGAPNRFRTLVVLLAASLFGAIVSASIGAGGLAMTGAIPWDDFGYTWWVWWLGDSLGFILVAPLLLAWTRTEQVIPTARAGEAIALSILLVMVSLAVFGPWNRERFGGLPLAYAVFPFVVWAALRFERPGATLATLVASGLALWGAVEGHGPFSRASQAEMLLLWQVYSVILAITSLCIAGVAIERNRAERELRHDAATLEERVAERTLALQEQTDQIVEISYSMSHDLRAPIRAIHGYVDALVDDVGERLGGTGREYLRRIQEATRRMDSMIENLLAYGRLSNVELTQQPLRMEEVVTEALALVEPEFKQREARVRVDVSDALPPVFGHRLTIVQALVNLLVNAVKFVPADRKPEVTIRAASRLAWVRLSVADNGIGIRPEHQDRIFRVFERLHAADSYSGTGIGLAMVKRSMERMGGAVGVESEFGRGSQFWIELRIAGVPAPSLDAEPQPNVHAGR